MSDFPFKKFTFQNFGKPGVQGDYDNEHYVKSKFSRGETIFNDGGIADSGITDGEKAANHGTGPVGEKAARQDIGAQEQNRGAGNSEAGKSIANDRDQDRHDGRREEAAQTKKQTASSFQERLESIMREDKKVQASLEQARMIVRTSPQTNAYKEARMDDVARERMMYEGSDRDTAPAKEAAQAPRSQAANQTPAKSSAGQKAYPVRPLTQKPLAQKKDNRPQTTSNRPRLIGICNQKGGVGKTTTAINLATALAAVGKRVLIIDMDPQGNASTGLGVRRSAIRTSVYDVLFEGADVVEAAVTTRVPNLSVVPSSIHLSGAEIELVTAENREYRLKKALHRPLPFDYVIVDCPPSLNLLTLNALVAMDSILVPLQCEFYALEGLSHLVKTIERVQKSFNPGLDIHGIILTMYDLRNKLSAQVEDDVRSHFGDKVYKTVIPRNVRLSEAPSFGLPAIIYDMKCSGAQAYIKLAREVILRERNIAKAANEGGDDGSAQVA